MFFDEIKPFLTELTQQPLAFLGGFSSGVLKLRLTDDPLKSWLEQQGISAHQYETPSNPSGPQSISID